MKHILPILLSFTPLLCTAQIKISEISGGDTLINDTLYLNAKMSIQINELQNILTIKQIGFDSEKEDQVEYKIESNNKVSNQVFLKASQLLDGSETLNITIDLETNEVRFEIDEETFILAGKGVNIFYSNKRDLDRCIIRD